MRKVGLAHYHVPIFWRIHCMHWFPINWDLYLKTAITTDCIFGQNISFSLVNKWHLSQSESSISAYHTSNPILQKPHLHPPTPLPHLLPAFPPIKPLLPLPSFDIFWRCHLSDPRFPQTNKPRSLTYFWGAFNSTTKLSPFEEFSLLL